MKISNSKKQLAKIIHENGGWRDGAEWAAQDKDGEVFGFCQKPKIGLSREVWGGEGGTWPWATRVDAVRNWHQTILSRDEYFHLYPAPDADGWVEWSGGGCPCPFDSGVARRRDGTEMEFGERNSYNWRHDESCPRGRQIVAYRPRKPEQAEPAPEPVVEAKPTIEQLAADYRNVKDYADRKQQEADAAKADAEVKLAELVAAGKALGLVLSVAGVEPEPERAITDWLDLQVGDEVEYVSGTLGGFSGEPGAVSSIDRSPDCGIYRIRVALQNGRSLWCDEWRFIRRPAKGDTNA